jgi:AcrR family transcriptional regulator
VAKPAAKSHDAAMDDAAFDTALIAAAFQLAAEQGWHRASVVAAARAAGLPLARARERFPSRSAILLRFGRLVDQAALTEAPSEGPVRDRLFDLLMRRIDALQVHRIGVVALLRALPSDPLTAVLLALATRRSMRWMLEAAGIPTRGIHGELRVKGLVTVWLWTLRAWRADDNEDARGQVRDDRRIRHSRDRRGVNHQPVKLPAHGLKVTGKAWRTEEFGRIGRHWARQSRDFRCQAWCSTAKRAS